MKNAIIVPTGAKGAFVPQRGATGVDAYREFIHGLTREAPVTFTLKDGSQLASTVWAVGFYNDRAAYTLGEVWKPDGNAVFPTSNMAFPEGAVIGKLLFTTATGTPTHVNTETKIT